jgi:hypothetical protein
MGRGQTYDGFEGADCDWYGDLALVSFSCLGSQSSIKFCRKFDTIAPEFRWFLRLNKAHILFQEVTGQYLDT